MFRFWLWSTAPRAPSADGRTRDELIHHARNFLHLISCLESDELELLSRLCHWSFGLHNHLVPCGRLVVGAKDALRQHPNRTAIRIEAAAMVLEGRWFANVVSRVCSLLGFRNS